MPDVGPASAAVVNSVVQGQQFFSTPEITQRLDLLRHLTDNSERVVVLRGGEGAGKSTIFQRYQQVARSEWLICPIVSNPMLHPEQLFALLGRCFGVQGDDERSVDLLVERFEALGDEGRTPVIAVDDAHQLPLSTIIALLRLHERRTGDHSLVRVFLFAEPQIDDLLQTPQIKAMNLQVLQMLDLPLFSRDQVAAFIAYISGGNAGIGELVDDAEIDRIARASGGVPGLIEEQVIQLRSRVPGGTSVQSRRGLLGLPLPTLMGGGAVVVLVIIALLFQGEINSLFEGEDGALELPGTMQEIELTVPAEVPRALPAAADESDDRQPTSVVGMTPPEAEPVMVEFPDAQTEGEVAEEQPLMTAKETPSEPDGADQPDPVVLQESVTDLPVKPIVERLVDPSVAVVAPVSSPAMKSEPEEAPREILAVASKLKVQTRPVEAVDATLRGEAWLQLQRPAAYTLQLIGVQSWAAADAFIQRHKMGDEGAIFETVRQGKPWFSVIYGVYDSREAAVAARAKLPVEGGRNSAWPRTFSSIQQAIKKP